MIRPASYYWRRAQDSKPATSSLVQQLFARYNFDGPLISVPEIPSNLAIAFIVIISAAGLLFGRIHYSVSMNSLIASLLTLWVGGLAFRVLGLASVANVLCLVSVFLMLVVSILAASMILATLNAPYADNVLVACDRILFPNFDWPGMIFGLEPHRVLLLVLAYVYASIEWQPMLLLLLVGIRRSPELGWRFLTAWSIAAVITLIVFAFVPAGGAYSHFSITRLMVPNVLSNSAWKYPVVLAGLRHGTITSLSLENFFGIIAMPSFHAAAAIILAWAFWYIRWLRWPFAALNTVMLISAVPIGGHYLIDILAGVAVAIFAIIVATGFHRRFATPVHDDVGVT